MPLLAAEAERRLIHDVLRGFGASEPAAAAVADDVLEADLRGHESHGLARLELQAQIIEVGTVDPLAQPAIEEARAAALVVDGRRALGPYAITVGVQHAIERARTAGTCAVTIHSHGYGAYYGRYAELGVDGDCIVMAFSKSSRWNVHAFGGVQPVLGSNPMAVGIPTLGDPLLLDMSTAAVANGRLQAAARAGESIPLGFAIDADGNPTVDPRQAMRGATSPFGGAKGYGLGLVVEVIGGLLARSGVGPQVDADGRATPWSSSAIVLNVAAFMDPAEFRAQVSDYLAQVKASRAAPGFDEILLPGERGYRLRRERLQSGIPVPDGVWPDIERLATRAGIQAASYL